MEMQRLEKEEIRTQIGLIDPDHRLVRFSVLILL